MDEGVAFAAQADEVVEVGGSAAGVPEDVVVAGKRSFVALTPRLAGARRGPAVGLRPNMVASASDVEDLGVLVDGLDEDGGDFGAAENEWKTLWIQGKAAKPAVGGPG